MLGSIGDFRMSAPARKTKSTKPLSDRDIGAPERCGHIDAATGPWMGHPSELTIDLIALDKSRPDDLSKVNRIQSGALALHQSGRITDGQLVAADRWHDNWSVGTGHPLQTSPMRFLGVSLGGTGAADGLPLQMLGAATETPGKRSRCMDGWQREADCFRLSQLLPASCIQTIDANRNDLSAKIIATRNVCLSITSSSIAPKHRKPGNVVQGRQ
jgi:hypothetical protein